MSASRRKPWLGKSRKKPGHREGVRSNRRPGQLALVTENTLVPNAPRCYVCLGRGCEFCPSVH